MEPRAAARPSPRHNPLVRAYDATLQPLFHSIAGLFGTPVGQTDYIKRVIGVPGDRRGLLHRAGPGDGQRRAAARVVVPATRAQRRRASASTSSCRPAGCGSWATTGRFRTTRGCGRVTPATARSRRAQVIGRAFVIVWPPSHWRILPIPSTFSQPGISKAQRLSRAGPPAAPAQPGRAAAACSAAKVHAGSARTCRWRPAWSALCRLPGCSAGRGRLRTGCGRAAAAGRDAARVRRAL